MKVAMRLSQSMLARHDCLFRVKPRTCTSDRQTIRIEASVTMAVAGVLLQHNRHLHDPAFHAKSGVITCVSDALFSTKSPSDASSCFALLLSTATLQHQLSLLTERKTPSRK